MTRPKRLVGVAGTGTEIGKTFVVTALATELRRRGRAVAARKPVQSFGPGGEVTDAEILAAATGERTDEVCPRLRWFEVPMAPPMAAEVLGMVAPTLGELVDGIDWPDTTDVGLVETVGGVRSPLADDGDSRDLLRAVDPDLVVLVADAGLGTIDAVRLATEALAPLPVVVVLNRFDPGDDLHRRNLAWLTARDGLDCVVDVADLADRVDPT